MEVIALALIGLFVVTICTVFFSMSDGSEGNEPNKQQERTVRYKYNSDEFKKEQKIRIFWEKALLKSYEYVDSAEIDLLMEFISNIWNTRDKIESARDLHILLDCVIAYLYPKRDLLDCRNQIIELCFLDLSNMGNLLDANPNSVVRSTTKLAIMLEQSGRIEEAIDLCDFCIGRDLPDHGYSCFSARKEHLKRKQKNALGMNREHKI